MVDITNDLEVEGSIVAVIHNDESGTESVRTVLGLTTKEDLSVSVEEDDEDFNPGSVRRTKRFRTNNTIDVEVTSAIAPDLEALEKIGVADSDGKITFATEDRKTGEDEFIEIAYFNHEPDFETVDFGEESELMHRFAECELTSPEVDPSETPPTANWTWWVEGDAWISYEDSA